MSTNRHTPYVLWLLAAVVLAAGVAGAAWIISHPSPGNQAGDENAASSIIGLPVMAQGLVDVEGGVAPLSPLQPGRVARVLVAEGDEVPAGEELLRMEDGPARLRVQEAQAAREAAETQLADALDLPRQHQVKIRQQEVAVEVAGYRLLAAQQLLQRKRELHRSKNLSAEEVAIQETQVKEIEALERAEKIKLSELQAQDPSSAVRRARAEVTAAQARLEQARHALEECVLRAPADGWVLRVHVSPGEVLGGPPRQPAIMFCPRNPRIVRAEVAQEFAGQVAAGQPAEVTDDADRTRTWHGRVKRVSDWYTQRRSVGLEPTQYRDVRTVECIIELDDQPALRIGQRVRVRIGPSAR